MSVSYVDVQVSDLSEDDRILYTEGIINLDGSPTTAGWDLVRLALFEDKKADVIKTVKKVVASRTEK